MSVRISVLAMSAAIALGAAPLATADASFSKDLAATIALQGLPCDKVVEAKRNADSDYTALCKDGSRYHIYLNAQGRVIVQKM